MSLLRSKLFNHLTMRLLEFTLTFLCLCMVVSCLLEITYITIYSTQAFARGCDIYMLMSEFFQINVQCTYMVSLACWKSPRSLYTVPKLLQEVATSTCLCPSSFRLMSSARTWYPWLAGNHLDHCIQYPSFCKRLRHLHAYVRVLSD